MSSENITGVDVNAVISGLAGKNEGSGIIGGYCEEGFPLFHANEAMVRMLGYDDLDDLRRGIDGLVANTIHPDDMDHVTADLGSDWHEGMTYVTQYRMPRKDGTWFWTVDRGEFVRAKDGRLAILSVCTDMTNFMQRQAELEKKTVLTESMFASLPGGYHRCADDPYYTFLYIGQRFLDILGWTEEEIRTKFDNRFINLVHPDDRKLTTSYVERIESTQGETPQDEVYRLAAKQGGWRWVTDSTMKVNVDGTTFYQGFITDITEFIADRNKQERQLRENFGIINALGSEFENLFLVRIADETYLDLRLDETGMHKGALDAVLPHSNYIEAFGVYFDNFVAPEDRERLHSLVDSGALVRDTPEQGIHTITYNRIWNGETYHYQLISAKFTDEDGQPFLVIGFRNITSIVEEEQRKNAELSTMHAIIEAAEMGTWRIELVEGQPGRMYPDRRMLELLGLADISDNMSPEEIYDAWYSRIKPETAQSVLDSATAMEAGKRDENTYLYMHPTLGERWVRCGSTSRSIEGGYELRGYHYDVDDIMREQLRQEQLLKDALAAAEHASHAKTTFLNNMSHDIRTPMNAIMGYTALAATHLDNKEQVSDYLSKISVSSSHLLSLINDVLDMSRIESGKVSIEEKETSLPDVMHDIRTIMQANVSAKQLNFLIDTVDVVHENVICDSLRLQQVLLNMLSNAVKFTEVGGTVGLRVTEKPGTSSSYARYEFSVRDTGIGMSREFQQHIFEPFTREQSSTVSGIQGTGLGMAITKNIVDMMGGEISVSSQLGRGSTFVVTLDCRTADAPVEIGEIEELRGIRALVADDDSDTAVNVSNMLKSVGMRCDWTLSGKEAVLRSRVAVDEGDAYGAYIIDWLMPDMNGIETVRQIRRHIGNDSVPIVILTAYDWADIEDEARAAGVTAFVSKPIFMSELRGVLCREASSEGADKTAATEALEAEAACDDSDVAGTRVLLVEDNTMNQEIAEAILSQRGIVVDVVDDGEVAVRVLSKAKAGDYDLVFMDIQMPRMNGYDATRAIRSLGKAGVAEIPIVAMSANAFDEDRALAEQAGMNDYITKPIDIEKTIDVIRKYAAK